MYEARQNKEKVSRRIDGGGMARQRVKMDYKRIQTFKCIQYLKDGTLPQKDTSYTLLDIMTDKRVSENYWNQDSLSKNFAFDENDTSNYAFSRGNGHSEVMVMAIAGAKGHAKNLCIVTERYPCNDCQNDIKRIEGIIGQEIPIKFFVPYNESSAKNLFLLYNEHWEIPGYKYND